MITNENFAIYFLSNVSYFRFIQYLRPMEANKTTHTFKANSKFEDAVKLYEFDIELRTLLFKAIQQIEISLRTKIIHNFSIAHGAFWFFDTNLADDEHKFIENINSLDRELNRSKEDFIKEHKAKYNKPYYPPAWKTLELATLGTLSKLYYNFNNNRIKKQIAREFNLPQHEVLESWLRSITVLRNCCAHHSRLWNKKLPNAPQINITLRGDWIDTTNVINNKLYAILSCLLYWLNSINCGEVFKNDFKKLLSLYPQIDIKAMGFPKDLNTQPLWK